MTSIGCDLRVNILGCHAAPTSATGGQGLWLPWLGYQMISAESPAQVAISTTDKRNRVEQPVMIRLDPAQYGSRARLGF